MSTGKKIFNICRAITTLLLALTFIAGAAWCIWLIFRLKHSGKVITGPFGIGLYAKEPQNFTVVASWYPTTTIKVLSLNATGTTSSETTELHVRSSSTYMTFDGPSATSAGDYYWTTSPVTETVTKTSYWPVYDTVDTSTSYITGKERVTGSTVLEPLHPSITKGIGAVIDGLSSMAQEFAHRHGMSMPTPTWWNDVERRDASPRPEPTAAPDYDPKSLVLTDSFSDIGTAFIGAEILRTVIRKTGFVPNRRLVYPLLVTGAVFNSLLATYFLYKTIKNCMNGCKGNCHAHEPLPDVEHYAAPKHRRHSWEPTEQTYQLPHTDRHAQGPTVRISKQPKQPKVTKPHTQPKTVLEPTAQPATTGTFTRLDIPVFIAH